VHYTSALHTLDSNRLARLKAASSPPPEPPSFYIKGKTILYLESRQKTHLGRSALEGRKLDLAPQREWERWMYRQSLEDGRGPIYIRRVNKPHPRKRWSWPFRGRVQLGQTPVKYKLRDKYIIRAVLVVQLGRCIYPLFIFYRGLS
jgi:hypothetical protein